MGSRFHELCDALNKRLTPALRSAGYTGPNEEFSRHTVKYEFTRTGPSGTETIAILFNRNRTPQFAVQLYVAPLSGLDGLEAAGGDLIVGALCPRRARWPFGMRAFGQPPTFLARLLGQSPPSASQVVQSALVLLPEVEAWWREPRATRHIVTSTVRFPGHQ